MMRVTSQSLSRNFLSNLNSHMLKINQYSNEVSSGKKLMQPSDDPYGATTVLELRSMSQQNDQYLRNIEDGQARLSTLEDSVNSIQNLVLRSRDIATMAANGTQNDSDRQIMAEEVNQLLEQAVSIANNESVFGYSYGGTQTEQEPFFAERNDQGEITSVMTTGNIFTDIYRVIDKDTKVKVNVDSAGIFSGDQTLFQSLIQLRDSLQKNQPTEIQNSIERMNNHHEQLTSKLSEIGVRLSHLSNRTDEINLESTNIQSRMSDIEDADITSSIVHLQEAQTAYQAALLMGGQLLQSSIMNFLK